ncbi:Multifunctional conjugation protein TraI [Burkholderia multivorans]|nr:Multifunctional conjugation protein TraI [Burkholderia multivorans]HDR9474426.1 relaxase domain-containing protein [Burkholderia multivorans]HDR9480268.1 relaxase domain-containing protein [Burkholderia multivorans]
MLTFSFVKESRQAAKYYEQTDDYYTKEGHRGEWDGAGAEALGLQGGVDQQTFKDLLEGKLPDGRVVRKPTPKTNKDGKKANARLGIDFTFSAPKSVSIVALVSGDRRVIAAHDAAVADALKMLESKVVARKKVKKVSFREHTNNFVVAKFQHDLSRDQDPQLHTHAVVMNLTQREDKRWTALSNEEMLKSVKVVGAYYRARLAERLQDMGYDIRATRHGFEMASIPDAAIEMFSQRSRTIEKHLDAQGLTRDTASGGVKQTITKSTRKRKDEGDRAALRNEWRQALEKAGITIPQAAPEHQVAPTRTSASAERATTPPEAEQEVSRSSAPGASGAGRADRRIPADKPASPNVQPTHRDGQFIDPADSHNSRGAAGLPEHDIGQPGGQENRSRKSAVPASGDPPSAEQQRRAREALNFAIEHLAERQGIFTHGELLERAYMKALGGTQAVDRELELAKADGRLLPELPLYQTAKSFSREEQAKSIDPQFEKFRHDNELHKLTRASWVSMLVNIEGYSPERAEKTVDNAIASGRLVPTEERYTTPEMRRRELRILWMERLGRDTVQPIKASEEVDAMLAKTDLNAGQREAAKLVLTTTNRVVGVQGFAGVGKSHMLSKSVEAIKAETAKMAAESGYRVIGLAPYGSQNKALKELGMDSQTLASFLAKEPEPGVLGRNTIVFLDEASVVPAHQMEALMKRIEQHGARLVLLGDRKQTQAVEAGKPFEQLQDAGMQLAHITEIQRQKNVVLKSAVEKAANDNIQGAVFALTENVRQIDDAAIRYKAIADAYASMSQDERNNTLIVVGTNESRRAINNLVRENLKLPAGELIPALESYDMTRAERRYASSYKAGLILLAERDGSHGLKRGEHFKVVSIDAKANQLRVVGKDTGELLVDASKLDGISSYERTEIELVQGDWLRITRNNNKVGVYNGERHRVAAVEPDAIVLENGARLSRENAIHAQHGYAQTVHSAQGLTTNRVLMDADTHSLTANRAVFYVAISRARHDLAIYTDDRSRLAETMSREPKKYAALELRDGRREEEILRVISKMRRGEREARSARQELARDIRGAGARATQQRTVRRNRTR